MKTISFEDISNVNEIVEDFFEDAIDNKQILSYKINSIELENNPRNKIEYTLHYDVNVKCNTAIKYLNIDLIV